MAVEKFSWFQLGVVVLGVCFGLVCLYISIVPLITFDKELSYVQGEYVSYREEEYIAGRRFSRRRLFKIDDQEYKFPVYLLDYFDKEAFFENVKPGDEVNLILNNEGVILSISDGEGRYYLTYEDGVKGSKEDFYLGIALGFAFIVMGLWGGLSMVPRRKRWRRTKRYKRF